MSPLWSPTIGPFWSSLTKWSLLILSQIYRSFPLFTCQWQRSTSKSHLMMSTSGSVAEVVVLGVVGSSFWRPCKCKLPPENVEKRWKMQQCIFVCLSCAVSRSRCRILTAVFKCSRQASLVQRCCEPKFCTQTVKAHKNLNHSQLGFLNIFLLC